MEGIYAVLVDFFVDAGKVACFMGIVTYCINIFIRAAMGKEVIL